MRKTLTAFALVAVAGLMMAAYPRIQVDNGRILVTGGKIQFAAAGATASGGIVTTNNGWIIHTFTNFLSATNIAPLSGTPSCEFLACAGGAGGGGNVAGGGGGGGVITGSFVLTESLSIQVGAGGATLVTKYATGIAGSNSWIGTNNAIGGGGGGGQQKVGANGGSGGGGGDSGSYAGGTGTVGQGHNGGLGKYNPYHGAGGGGGASEQGGDGTCTNAGWGGDGGEGIVSSISGSEYVYASGGGGGGLDLSETPEDLNHGIGGTGAGTGGFCKSTTPIRSPSAATNYGCGGGGGSWEDANIDYGAAGYQGVVIVRYPQ